MAFKTIVFHVLFFVLLQGTFAQDTCVEPEDCKSYGTYEFNGVSACELSISKVACPCTCKDFFATSSSVPLHVQLREALVNSTSKICEEISISESFTEDTCKYLDNEPQKKLESAQGVPEITTYRLVSALPSPIKRTQKECEALCLQDLDCLAVYVGSIGSEREGECLMSFLSPDTLASQETSLELYRKNTQNLCEGFTCSCIPDLLDEDVLGVYDCSNRGLSNVLEELGELPTQHRKPLSYNLRSNPIKLLLAQDFSHPWLYDVETLDLTSCELVFIEATTFSPLENLRIIFLSNNPLAPSSFNFDGDVGPFSKLRRVTGTDTIEIFTAPIRRLDISDTKIDTIDATFFESNQLTQLDNLIARNLDAKYIGLDAFYGLSQMLNESVVDSTLEYGGNELDTNHSNCILRGKSIFCECADLYGPGYWKDAQGLDHHGCFPKIPAPDAPLIVKDPILSESGNDAEVSVSVQVGNATVAYITIDGGGAIWPVCCEPAAISAVLDPLSDTMQTQVQQQCPSEGISCDKLHEVRLDGLTLDQTVSFIVVATNEARIEVTGQASSSVKVPPRDTYEESFLEKNYEYIVIAIVLFLVLVVSIGLYVRRLIRLRPVSKQSFAELLESLKREGFIAENEYYEAEHIIPTELPRGALKMISVLGSGAFGEVRKASLVDNYDKGYPDTVAVKVTKPGATEDKDEFLREAVISAQFDHENIVRMIGVVTSGEPLLMVIELCENGNLKGFLDDRGDKGPMKSWGLTLDQNLTICKHSAKGLQHLSEKRFVHRDIAARNILVTSSLVFKIADFGLGREVNDAEEAYYRADRRGPLPVRWCSPEALNDQKFSMASDVWAWGVLAYEIFTSGSQPYEGMSNNEVWVKVSDGYRLPRPEACPEEIWEQIILPCFNSDPKTRPSFEALVLKLDTKDKRSTTFDPDYIELLEKGMNEYANDLPFPEIAYKDTNPTNTYEYSDAAPLEASNSMVNDYEYSAELPPSPKVVMNEYEYSVDKP